MVSQFSNAGNRMLANVVRQFASSRIERELIAQVFEIVILTNSAHGPGVTYESVELSDKDNVPGESRRSLPTMTQRAAA